MSILNRQVFRQKIPMLSFPLGASLSMVNGVSVEVKFGDVPDAASGVETDVWALGGSQPVYIPPDEAGETVEIVSTNAADASQITVRGLDAAGALQSQVVTLNGTTPVAVGGVWRSIHRAFTSNAIAFAGNVSVRGDGSTSANVFAHLLPRDQQTTQAIYRVPAGHIAVVKNYSTAVNKGGGQSVQTVMRLKACRPGGVFRTDITYGLNKEGTSNISSDLIVPSVYPALTCIKVTGTPDVAAVDISAEFSMYLIDENYLPPAFVAAL